MEVNELENPDELSAGVILNVPITESAQEEPISESEGGSESEEQPLPTSTPPPILESSTIKIVTLKEK